MASEQIMNEGIAQALAEATRVAFPGYGRGLGRENVYISGPKIGGPP